MAEGEGNGKSYDHLRDIEDTYETNMWRSLGGKLQEVADERDRATALYVFDSETVEEVAAKLHTLRRGTWLDNLLLAGAAVGGMLAGHAMQGWMDLRKGGVPLTGLLGLVPIGAGLAMDRSLTARNAVGLSGMLFLAGAGLYTRTNPAIEDEVEE
jgi:hypothetical protein